MDLGKLGGVGVLLVAACSSHASTTDRSAGEAEGALSTMLHGELCSRPAPTADGKVVLHDECPNGGAPGVVVAVDTTTWQRTPLLQHAAGRKVATLGSKGSLFIVAIDRPDGAFDVTVGDTTAPTQVHTVVARPRKVYAPPVGAFACNEFQCQLALDGNRLVFAGWGDLFVADIAAGGDAARLEGLDPGTGPIVVAAHRAVAVERSRSATGFRMRFADLSAPTPAFGAWHTMTCPACPATTTVGHDGTVAPHVVPNEQTFDGASFVASYDDRIVSVDAATGTAALLDARGQAEVFGITAGDVVFSVYDGSASTLLRVPLGGGAARELLKVSDAGLRPFGWSEDGASALVLVEGPGSSARADLVDLSGAKAPVTLGSASNVGLLDVERGNGANRFLVNFAAANQPRGIIDAQTGQLLEPLSAPGGARLSGDGSIAVRQDACDLTPTEPGRRVVRITASSPVALGPCLGESEAFLSGLPTSPLLRAFPELVPIPARSSVLVVEARAVATGNRYRSHRISP